MLPVIGPAAPMRMSARTGVANNSVMTSAPNNLQVGCLIVPLSKPYNSRYAPMPSQRNTAISPLPLSATGPSGWPRARPSSWRQAASLR